MALKFLVTGGAGFIGAQVVRDLLSTDKEVLVYDDLSIGQMQRLPDHHPGLQVEIGDVLDATRLREVVTAFRPDYVFHLAAVADVLRSDAFPTQTIHINVEGTQTVLQCCKSAELRGFLLASSSWVYPPSNRSHRENDTVGPIEVYGLSKLFGEMLVRQYHADTGTPCVIVRPFNVYGPGDTNPRVMATILTQLAAGRRMLSLGNLYPKRDYIFVTDVSKAMLALLKKRESNLDVFNIGTGKEYSVLELVQCCAEVLGEPIEIQETPNLKRERDRDHLLADVSKLRVELDWRPEFDLRAGLRVFMQSIGMVGNEE